MSGDTAELTLDPSPGGVGFFIHVTPRARVNAVGPAHGDALRVRITAPPVEGRANAACRAAIATALCVARRDVELAPGSRGRRKHVFVAGDPVDLAARVRMLAARSGLG